MEKKYLDYTIEKMVDDREFLIWLNRVSENHELDKLVHENPQFALRVSRAREIFHQLIVKEESVLQEDIYSMWENIVQFDHSYRTQNRIRNYARFLKYAALILFLLLFSALGFWKLKQGNENQYYAFQSGRAVQQSRLILSSGEVIDLKKDESSVRVNAQSHAIKINNDTTISLSTTHQNNLAVAMNQVDVPFGKKSIVELADGTKVWLNAGSKMAFPDRFTDSQREVFLEGEAFFNVTADKNRPFFVKTKEVVVRVLGTKFDLSAYESDRDVMTVLVEGTVSLSVNKGRTVFGKEVILNGHQRAMFNKTDLTTKVNQEDHVEIFTAWTEGWFPFYKEPLNNVFRKVERYYNVQFVYNELFPSGDLISGKLDLKESIEEVMKVLADVANVSYQIDQNKIYIELNNEMPMRK